MNNNNESQAFSTNVLDKSSAFIEKNKKILLYGIIAVVAIIAGTYAYSNLVLKPKAEKASYFLSKGQNYFAMGNFNVALNGDNVDYVGFIKLAQKYSGTDAGNLANLYAGLTYAQEGDANNALKYLEKFNRKDDKMISPAAIGAMGNCYAKIGKIDKAISLLKEAAEKADNNSLSPIFLIQAGELLESQNKKEEALKLYQQIKDNYNKSAEAEFIDKYIQRVS